ncbi:MAG: exodeoxyribonuclease VII large subunit [Chloroflexota bacterium]
MSEVARAEKPLRVSQLTRYLKYLFEHDELLGSLSVEGEICEFTRSNADHVYFTLKDNSSQIFCVLFRRQAEQQRQEVARMRKGLEVVVQGYLTVYELRGTYQIFVQRVSVRGEGSWQRRFEQLRSKLDQEGLFAEGRKRTLPANPKKVALITSPGSQAYHDVLHRIRTQYPFVRVIVAGASVQGDGAADEVIMALDIVNRLTDADVVLLVRGGGAPEDLLAFNNERLARAIFASRIPVITGIGHETDQTIADLVADRRAATPSLAAAVAVPDASARIALAHQLRGRLTEQMTHRQRSHRSRLLELNQNLVRCSPQTRLRGQQQRADNLSTAAHRAVRNSMAAKRGQLAGLRGRLVALDPLAILSRGYAVLSDVETGSVVASVAGTAPGRMLRARVSDGDFRARVEST